MNKIVVGALVLCGFTASSAQAALIDRGGGLIYDTVLNITWLQDANYAATQYVSSGGAFGDADGRMDWQDARSWAFNLVINVGGVVYDNWRLPTVGPIGTTFNYGFSNNGTTDSGYGNTSPNSELAYMFYVNLGNLGLCTPNNSDPTECKPQSGWGLANTGPFTNLQSGDYWSGKDYAPSFGDAWYFRTAEGRQDSDPISEEFHGWAVRDGDVAIPPVPLPAAAWLLLSGLAGLGFLGRRRKH